MSSAKRRLFCLGLNVLSVIRGPAVAPSDARTVLDALPYLNTLSEPMLKYC